MNSATKFEINIKLFQERLKDLRGEKSLQEVATALGISRATLGYYESGDRKPDIEMLLRIADYYNVSCDYLLGLTDVRSMDIEDRAISEKIGLSEEAIAVLYEYNNSKTYPLNIMRLTIEILISVYPTLLILISEYLFYRIDSACEVGPYDQNINTDRKVFEHYEEYDGQIPDSQIPASKLGFYDERLNTILCCRNKDFMLNNYLVEIQKELVILRGDAQTLLEKSLDKINMLLNM